MKTRNKFFMLLTLSLVLIIFTSCKKDNDDPAQPDTLPDAEFNATTSGAESENYTFTLPQGQAGTYAINGSHVSNVSLFQMTVMELPAGWQMSIAVNMDNFGTGTYQLNQGQTDISSYHNDETGMTYISTSGTLNITKADQYLEAGSRDGYYIEGSFPMQGVDSSTPPQQITVSGTFKGIYIGTM
jgi:hypothetical protein